LLLLLLLLMMMMMVTVSDVLSVCQVPPDPPAAALRSHAELY